VILVDTSVWIQHFRTAQADLTGLLEESRVLIHPFVVGELACGSLRRRQEVLSLLTRLEPAPRASDGEVLELIEVRRLMGRGLGWVGVHLIASCLISTARLWTLDRRLKREVERLGIAA
jgi:predicted nucleic acid-binding protein